MPTKNMFTKRHYDYLINAIINAPNLDHSDKFMMIQTLGKYFERDFSNFNRNKWHTAWKGVIKHWLYGE